MSVSVRPKWHILLDPSFRTIAHNTEKQFVSKVDQVFRMNTSDKAFEKDTSVSGLGRLTQIAELEPIQFESPVNGYPVTYTHLTFAKGEAISQQMYDDDSYNVIKRAPRRLMDAKMRTREFFAADIFNYGFTYGGGGSTFFNGGDGKALFATDHPIRSGGSQSNMTTMDLDEDALETAILAMTSTKDNKGELQVMNPDTLLVPRALEKEARILLDSQQRSGTGNNDINPYKGAMKLVVWDHLGAAAGGSDTAWFVLDSSQHELNWFTRQDKGIEGPEWDFESSCAKWKVWVRWSVGFSDWRGVFGSRGDNS